MSKLWTQCLEQLQKTSSLQDYTLAILKINAYETKNKLSLTGNNKHAIEWLNANIDKIIKPVVVAINKTIKLELVNKKTSKSNKKQVLEKLSTPLTKEYTFNNLVIGDANKIAAYAAEQTARNIAKTEFSPLIIYGNSGLGKTHILQAIGHLGKKLNPDIDIIYTPLINFVKHITSSIRHKKIESIKKYYQSVDLLLIDDIHLIADKGKTQEELFHIFNFLFANDKQIVLTCDTIPHNIKKVEDRILTRLNQGLSIQLKPPELELRAAILIQKAKKLKVEISEDVGLFIASKFTDNVRELEGALNRLIIGIRFNNITIDELTIEKTKDILGDLISNSRKIVDIEDIKKIIARYYGINITRLVSKEQTKNIVYIRQMAIHLSKKFTDMSLTKIGESFKRNHTTVIHADKKIIIKLNNDKEVIKDYKNLSLKIGDC